MSQHKKLLFIVNKHAGVGYQPHFEGKIIDACVQRGVECTIEYTSGQGHATTLAGDSVGKFDATIAVGGDGTVNEVAAGLVSTNAAMGILPTGSGNGLARHLGIPLSLEPALDSLFSGNTLHMDSFKINGRLSVNVSGLGFDGHIANLFGQNKRRGFRGYAWLVIREYIRFREFEWTTASPDIQRYKSFIVAVANSSQYGNNAWIAPDASVSDGQLNLSIVRKLPVFRGMLFAYRMFRRSLRNDNVFKSLLTDNITIRTDYPIAYHIDGEPCGTADTFNIQLLRSSIWVIVPSKKR